MFCKHITPKIYKSNKMHSEEKIGEFKNNLNVSNITMLVKLQLPNTLIRASPTVHLVKEEKVLLHHIQPLLMTLQRRRIGRFQKISQLQGIKELEVSNIRDRAVTLIVFQILSNCKQKQTSRFLREIKTEEILERTMEQLVLFNSVAVLITTEMALTHLSIHQDRSMKEVKPVTRALLKIRKVTKI